MDNEDKSNKLVKILIIIIILLVICLGVYLAYIFTSDNENNNEGNKDNNEGNKDNNVVDIIEKYRQNDKYRIEDYEIVLDNNFSISDDNFVPAKTTKISKTLIIPLYGGETKTTPKFKNGGAEITFSADNNKDLEVVIKDIYDVNNNSYLDELSEKSFIVKFKNEKVETITSDTNYIYILTDKGNLYITEFSDIINVIELEESLNNIKKKDFYDSITDKKIKALEFYYENNEYNNSKKLFAVLSNDKKMNVLNRELLEESEKYVSYYRFGNAGIVVNNQGNIQFCNNWQGKDYCSNDKLGEIIVDENNKPIKVAAMFTTDNSMLFIIDSNGYLYGEKYEITNHQIINTLKRYNNKTFDKFTYVSKYDQTYILEDFIINYIDGSKESFGGMSRITIYIKSIKTDDIEEFEDNIGY